MLTFSPKGSNVHSPQGLTGGALKELRKNKNKNNHWNEISACFLSSKPFLSKKSNKENF